ncbi:MAG: endonuclease/exonuclease/phosphatase family protein [Streptosporangiaceae bacterium]
MTEPNDARTSLRVATWNVYLGADLTAITSARDPESLAHAATEAMRQAERTQFPARAKVIADIISKSRPDVLGLQEVGRWEIHHDGERRSLWNHAELITEALERLGERYVMLYCSDTFSGELPLGDGRTVGFTNCDAMLLRATPDRPITVLDAGFGHFDAHLEVTATDGSTVPVKRGWVHADLEVDGECVRVISTHLASMDADTRRRQAHQLVTVASPSPYPTVLVGDLNAEPEDSAMGVITNAGYVDAWADAGHGTGATWGRSADLDREDDLVSRIDYVLVDPERLRVDTVELLGDDVAARTPGEAWLWASDHAGVLAQISLT